MDYCIYYRYFINDLAFPFTSNYLEFGASHFFSKITPIVFYDLSEVGKIKKIPYEKLRKLSYSKLEITKVFEQFVELAFPVSLPLTQN